MTDPPPPPDGYQEPIEWTMNRWVNAIVKWVGGLGLLLGLILYFNVFSRTLALSDTAESTADIAVLIAVVLGATAIYLILHEYIHDYYFQRKGYATKRFIISLKPRVEFHNQFVQWDHKLIGTLLPLLTISTSAGIGFLLASHSVIEYGFILVFVFNTAGSAMDILMALVLLLTPRNSLSYAPRGESTVYLYLPE